MKKTFILSGTADWKDTIGQFKVIADSLKELGIKMVCDPSTADSDSYSFIFLKEDEWKGVDEDKIKDELFDIVKPEYIDLFDIEEEEMDEEETENDVNREVDKWVDDIFEQMNSDHNFGD